MPINPEEVLFKNQKRKTTHCQFLSHLSSLGAHAAAMMSPAISSPRNNTHVLF